MTRRLYLSDLHLEDTDDRYAAFDGLLQRTAAEVDEIYLLGDICEIWIGDDDDTPLVDALAASCVQAARHAALFFMPGNRDFLLGERFAERAHLTRLPDPFRLDDATLLSHGDGLCTDDHAYQQLRAVMRAPEWQAEMLTKPLAERRAFGQALRERSRTENANKAANIMDVNPQATHSLMAEQQATLLIHGHTHRPGMHSLAPDPSSPMPQVPATRIVLGAWERCGWWLIQDTAQTAGDNRTLGCELHSQALAVLAG